MSEVGGHREKSWGYSVQTHAAHPAVFLPRRHYKQKQSLEQRWRSHYCQSVIPPKSHATTPPAVRVAYSETRHLGEGAAGGETASGSTWGQRQRRRRRGRRGVSRRSEAGVRAAVASASGQGAGGQTHHTHRSVLKGNGSHRLGNVFTFLLWSWPTKLTFSSDYLWPAFTSAMRISSLLATV